jgi:Predicted membrane protein
MAFDYRRKIKRVFDGISELILGVILLVLAFAMLIGLGDLVLGLARLWRDGGLPSGYLEIVKQVLNLLVLIELSRSFAEFFASGRVRLTFVVDAAIVFVLRDLMIALFDGQVAPPTLLGLAAVLLVLGVLRASTAYMSMRLTQSLREDGMEGAADGDSRRP